MREVLIRVEGFDLFSPAKVFLQNLSFAVRAGEIFFLQGTNGSGKSTLLKEIFDILSTRKKSQKIEVRGVSSFSYLPQSLNREFFIPLSLGEVAALAGRPEDYVHALSSLVPEEISHRMWNKASGGEKQRAVLVQTLSKKHSLYMLDEPFNHLDTASVDVVAKAIAELAMSGAAFLIATHAVPQSLDKKLIKTLIFESSIKERQCR